MKSTKQIAQKFHKDMQDLADKSDLTISVSSSGMPEKVIASPKKSMQQKNIEYLKNDNPSMDDIENAAKNLKRQNNISDAMANMVLQINKIKYDGTLIEIHYEQKMENTDDIKIVLKSYDKPYDEFIQCFNSLISFVELICNLPEGYCSDATVRGISLSYPREIMGAVITALIPVPTSNSPVCINTPFLPSDQYNEGGQAPVLPKDCIKTIEELIELTEEYIYGNRNIETDTQTKMEL